MLVDCYTSLRARRSHHVRGYDAYKLHMFRKFGSSPSIQGHAHHSRFRCKLLSNLNLTGEVYQTVLPAKAAMSLADGHLMDLAATASSLRHMFATAGNAQDVLSFDADKGLGIEAGGRSASKPEQAPITKPWLPWFVSVSSSPEEWRVDVQEAATLDEAVRGSATSGQPPPPGVIR